MGDQKKTNATVLGPDCQISGDLNLDNDAIILGSFSGTLRVTGSLELGESSQVSGTIIVGKLRQAGQAQADIVAEHGVELLPGSTTVGQIYTSEVLVNPGAGYQGDLTVGPDATAAAELPEAETTDESAGQANVMSLVTQVDEPVDDVTVSAEEVVETPKIPQVNTNTDAMQKMLRRRRPKVLRPAA